MDSHIFPTTSNPGHISKSTESILNKIMLNFLDLAFTTYS